jgi:CRP-like cAMP-binding protein
MYSNIFFFANRDESFVSWISSVVKSINFEEKEYIYKEGEIASSIYFLVKGHLCYVIPRYKNKKYKEIMTGEHFGHVDLAEYF